MFFSKRNPASYPDATESELKTLDFIYNKFITTTITLIIIEILAFILIRDNIAYQMFFLILVTTYWYFKEDSIKEVAELYQSTPGHRLEESAN